VSYLQMAETPLPDLTSAIISVWVKCSGKLVKDEEKIKHPWNEAWFPEDMRKTAGKKEIFYPGLSYYWTITHDGTMNGPPHLWPRPPGGDTLLGHALVENGYLDDFVPFITFGDPNLSYDRVEWKKKTLRTDMYILQLGGRGVATDVICQFPESVGAEQGIVPPSMIGVHKGKLRIILQTKDKADLKGYAWAVAKSDRIRVQTPYVGLPPDPRQAWAYVDVLNLYPRLTSIFSGQNFFYEDVSVQYACQHPETFVMDTDVDIADGKWHHILLSFDLNGTVNTEATGPAGLAPWPGPFGQYSGPNGDRDVNRLPFPESGAPNEDTGEFGVADGGTISSTCKAWLAVDDKLITGRNLNHSGAWDELKGKKGETGQTGEALLLGLEAENPNAILPPNAFLAPFGECREGLTTSLTRWERFYRTHLGGWTGPAAIIEESEEMRRYDHPRPKYQFSPSALPVKGHPIGIPAGEHFIDHNGHIYMAELQIWANKTLDVTEEENRRLFIKKDKDDNLIPVGPRISNEKLGRPEIRLRGTGNWKHGYNTGTIGVRLVAEGTPEQKKEKINEGQFEPEGQIDRHRPDPMIEAEKPPEASASSFSADEAAE
jgi:hypothetical protein